MNFLTGGGEAGALISAHDWSSTPLGPLGLWPPSLRNAISLLLRSPVPIVMLWGEDGVMLYNDAYSIFAGSRHPRLLGAKVRDAWPEVADFNDNVMRVGLAGGTLTYKDQELTLYRHGRAELVAMDLNYSPVIDESGTPAGVICILADTTERVASDRRLQIERERQRLMLQQMPGFAALLSGPQHRFVYVNDAYTEISGERTLIGRTVREAFPELEGQGYYERLDRVFSTGDAFAARELPIILDRLDGERFIDLQYEAVRDDAGEVTGIFVGGYDVTDRVRAQRRREALLKLDEVLRKIGAPKEIAYASAELLGEALGACRVGYGDIDPHAGTITVDRPWSLPGLPDVSGVHDFAHYGTYISELRAGRAVTVMDVEQDPRTAQRAAAFRAIGIRACLDAPVMEDGCAVAEVFVHSATPRVWTQEDVALALEFAGRTRATIARKRAEQELRELNETLERRVNERTAELMQAEEALRQAQKMEAVGQLTGGIAHDFNNLLAGISGSLELLEARLAQGKVSGLDHYVGAAQTSARRAASLTQRLLAFSRRQTLDPRPTDVNRLIAGMEELIRRTVGPSIHVEVVGAEGLWLTQIDPAQLESALLNLAINARDAVPEGGRIIIETANKWLDERTAKQHEVAAGQYISVCVTDTGVGMAPEVISRAFDPFFTTKPLGQGTGLGLSMVHGFVRQSGGQVRVYSELGRGTTMCLYLPRSFGALEDIGLTEDPAATDTGEGENVLVIDDEPILRMLIIEVVNEAGYTALEAEDGPSGLKILQSGEKIDLMITDVGLPGGLNGRQIADAARVTRPDLKVIFVTGYAENAVVGNGILAPGMAILTKPFVMDELARKIQSMIKT